MERGVKPKSVFSVLESKQKSSDFSAGSALSQRLSVSASQR